MPILFILKSLDDENILGSCLQEGLFKMNGDKYRIGVVSFHGFQVSPINVDFLSLFLGAANDYYITNLTTNEKIRIAPLAVSLALGYGFFEGKGTPYRLDPVKIVRTFPKFFEEEVVARAMKM